MPQQPSDPVGRPLLLTVRVGLPLAIAVAGGIVLIVGSGVATTSLGVVLIGVACLVVVVNLLARLTLSSQQDRLREQRARRLFTRTGRWPT